MIAQRSILLTLLVAMVMGFLLLALPSDLQAGAGLAAPALQLVAQVDTFSDEYDVAPNSTCSLREAIKALNDSADFGGCILSPAVGTEPNTILLPSGTYTLTIPGAGEDLDATGDLDVRQSLVISPTGQLTATVAGGTGWNDRLLQVMTGTMTVKHIEFRGGAASGTSPNNLGGAMRIDPGVTVVISDTEFVANSGFDGGGILNYGTLTLSNSVLTQNSASFSGGGIVNDHANLTLTNVTVEDNHAEASTGVGGGIYNVGGIVTLTNSTLSGNSTGGNGGAIEMFGGTATLTNATLSGNSATFGGGLHNNIATTALKNVTLSGNTASSGGGIYNYSGALTLVNTIVANSPSGGNCGIPLGGSFNLSTDDTCGFTSTRDNVDIMLGPLANNGGPTLTHMLLPGSPAIDFGTNSGCPTTDQRGEPRPVGNACDVGAVERQPDDPAALLFLPLILR